MYKILIDSRWYVLQNKSDDLKEVPDTLEDLKFVLKTITDIKDMSLDVEMRIRDIRERYRVLDMYRIPVSVYNIIWDICEQFFILNFYGIPVFTPRPGHTEYHHKNVTNCLPAWHAGIRVGVWQCNPTV